MQYINVPKTRRERIIFCSGYYPEEELRQYNTKQLFWICIEVIEKHEDRKELREHFKSITRRLLNDGTEDKSGATTGL